MTADYILGHFRRYVSHLPQLSAESLAILCDEAARQVAEREFEGVDGDPVQTDMNFWALRHSVMKAQGHVLNQDERFSVFCPGAKGVGDTIGVGKLGKATIIRRGLTQDDRLSYVVRFADGAMMTVEPRDG